jgi:hypothetical protein
MNTCMAVDFRTTEVDMLLSIRHAGAGVSLIILFQSFDERGWERMRSPGDSLSIVYFWLLRMTSFTAPLSGS